MINGVLIERTVKDVLPALETNSDGLKKVLDELVKQYKRQQEEMEKWKVSLYPYAFSKLHILGQVPNMDCFAWSPDISMPTTADNIRYAEEEQHSSCATVTTALSLMLGLLTVEGITSLSPTYLMRFSIRSL